MAKYSYLFRGQGEMIVISYDERNAWVYNICNNKSKKISGAKVIPTEKSITIIQKNESMTFSSENGGELIYLGLCQPIGATSFEEKDIEEAIIQGEIDIENYIDTERIGGLSLLGNQIQLNEGKDRMDLLYQSEKGVFVIVELKKGTIQRRDIEQTYRYSQIIDEIYSGESIAYLLGNGYGIREKEYADNLGIHLVEI